MLRRLHVLFLFLATCGLLAAGCGGGDGDGDGGDDNTPDTKGEAQQQCLDQAGRIDNADARKVAEEACNGNGDKARDAAVKQCLEVARGLPEGVQRKRAEDACEKSK